MKTPSLVLSCILIFLTGFIFFLYSTPWEVGIGYDSMAYITTAVNLTEGKGFYETASSGLLSPLIHFPPMYPIVLAFVSRITGDVVEGATLTGALLYAANITLIAFIVYLASKRWWLLASAALIAMVSPVILDIHLMAMSEPLFTCCWLLSICLITIHTLNARISTLILAAIFAAIAWLTRYIGVTIIFTGIVIIMVLRQASWKKKIQETVIYAAISITPMVVWLIRNTMVTGNLTSRTFVVHPLTRFNRKKALSTLTGWFEIPKPRLPDEFFNILLIIFLIFLIIMLIYALRVALLRKRDQLKVSNNTEVGLHLFYAFGIYTIAYIIFLLLSISFFDASTRLLDRILYPIYVSVFLYIFIWFGIFLDTTAHKTVYSAALIAGVGLVFVLFSNHSYDMVIASKLEGQGFNSASWTSSETIQALNELDNVAYVITTESDPVFFLTGIPARAVPQKFNPVSGEDLAPEEQQMSAMREKLSIPDTYLVLFYRSFNRREMFPLENYTESLTLISKHKDGSIYKFERD